MIAFLSASDTPLGDAALYAIIGFVIVILVLALLVGIFYLSGFIFKTKVMSRDKLFDFKKKAPKEPEIIAEEPVNTLDDDEVVAAITAAISVMISDSAGEGEKPEFVIRRITRKK